MNVSVIIRFECYFSLERKVTKSSRLHPPRYSASSVVLHALKLQNKNDIIAMILNYFKRFNHIHLRPLIQTLSIANRSIIIRSECYFSLDRKVTKRSRLHLLRYSASCVRCRLWTRYAQTAQPPGALYRCFALRSPDEAFHRTLCVLLGLPILPVKSDSFCSISTGTGHPKRKHSFLGKA